MLLVLMLISSSVNMTSKIFFLVDGGAAPFPITITSTTSIATIQAMIKISCPNKVASFVLTGAGAVALDALHGQTANSATDAYHIVFDDPGSTTGIYICVWLFTW